MTRIQISATQPFQGEFTSPKDLEQEKILLGVERDESQGFPRVILRPEFFLQKTQVQRMNSSIRCEDRCITIQAQTYVRTFPAPRFGDVFDYSSFRVRIDSVLTPTLDDRPWRVQVELDGKIVGALNVWVGKDLSEVRVGRCV